MGIRVGVQAEQELPVKVVTVDQVELVVHMALGVVAERLQTEVLGMGVMEEQGLLHLYLALP
jgi:hypothetical protein